MMTKATPITDRPIPRSVLAFTRSIHRARAARPKHAVAEPISTPCRSGRHYWRNFWDYVRRIFYVRCRRTVYHFFHRRKLAAEGAARLLCCMHISFAVFADAANLSQEGKLNVLGVFDAVQVAGLPTIHPRTHFIVRLKANRSEERRVGKECRSRWSPYH